MNEGKEYKIAYTQVLEIIKYLPIYYYEKIPKNLIIFLKANRDVNYKFEYNPNLEIKEQRVNNIALEILSIINEKFLTNNKT